MPEISTKKVIDEAKKMFKIKFVEASLNEEEIENRLNNLSESDIVECVAQEIIPKYAKDLVLKDSLKLFEKVFYNRQDVIIFNARNERLWGKCFAASDAMYFIAVKALNNYIQNTRKVTEKDNSEEFNNLDFVMSNLCGRALQQYAEIICLLRNGFADGAMARWRSMYEIETVITFISNYGEELAKSYVENYKSDDKYNWARNANCFESLKNNKRISFNMLLKETNIDNDQEGRRLYDLSNQLLHPSSKGTFSRLGLNANDIDRIISGRLNTGMSLPAQCAAFSLYRILSTYFILSQDMATMINSVVLYKWVEIIREYYSEIDDSPVDPDNPMHTFEDDDKHQLESDSYN